MTRLLQVLRLLRLYRLRLDPSGSSPPGTWWNLTRYLLPRSGLQIQRRQLDGLLILLSTRLPNGGDQIWSDHLCQTKRMVSTCFHRIAKTRRWLWIIHIIHAWFPLSNHYHSTKTKQSTKTRITQDVHSFQVTLIEYCIRMGHHASRTAKLTRVGLIRLQASYGGFLK